MTMQVRWECRESPNCWTRYPAEISQKINDELLKNSVFNLEVDSTMIEFDCEKMKLKNGKKSKDIRCSILNKDGVYIFWEKQVSRVRYTPLLPQYLEQLEGVKQDGSVNVDINGVKLQLDFENSLIVDGENVFKIRRLVSDATDAEELKQVVIKTTRKRAATAVKTSKSVPVPKIEDAEVVGKKQRLEKFLKTREKVELHADVDEFLTVSPVDKAVYVEGKDVYSVTLNQTNLDRNNNKFFVIQVLRSTRGSPKFWTFIRWGRVGFKGQTKLIECGKDLNKAKSAFLSKFSDKTSNEFADRAKFIKAAGKYDLLRVDYSKKRAEPPKTQKKKTDEVAVESKLDIKVKALLEMMCDLKKMEEAARKLCYDVKKSPLGNLTKAQIKAGYQALTRIEKAIVDRNFDARFKEAVNDYYTRIPHYFGMARPPMIDSIDRLKQELSLLEMLSEIEETLASVNEVADEKLHPTDEIYHKLGCEIKPMSSRHERYKLIKNYLDITHAPNHSDYKMVLKNVYELSKQGEKENFKAHIGNKRLLWHGSRLTNWHGILSRGLKIAPPEAPVTGYMFGKGVYFADMSSKSANYCCPDESNKGLLVLAEVALGDSNIKFKADCGAAKLPPNKMSVKGVGDIGPDPQQFVTIDDDVVVPCGKQIEQPETKNIKNNDLCFNEYIVYDTSQIKLRYLVEVEFKC